MSIKDVPIAALPVAIKAADPANPPAMMEPAATTVATTTGFKISRLC